MGPQGLPAPEMPPRRGHHTWTTGGGAFTKTGLMFRCVVMRLVSLAVVRKRAGRGESGPVAAKAPRRMRGPGRALSSNVRASCGRPVLCSSVAIYCLQARAPLDFETPQVGTLQYFWTKTADLLQSGRRVLKYQREGLPSPDGRI